MQHISEKRSQGKDPFDSDYQPEDQSEDDSDNISEPFQRFIDHPAAFHFQSGLSVNSNHDSQDAAADSESVEEEDDYFVIEWTPDPFDQIQQELRNLEEADGADSQDSESHTPDGAVKDNSLDARSSQMSQGLSMSLDLHNADGGRKISKDMAGTIAGSVRVVPVYHNYLNVEQFNANGNPNAGVVHGIDKHGPRYDVAAFRGAGASVSLNLKSIQGECGPEILIKGENGEVQMTTREMVCKIPQKLHENTKKKDVFPKWKLLTGNSGKYSAKGREEKSSSNIILDKYFKKMANEMGFKKSALPTKQCKGVTPANSLDASPNASPPFFKFFLGQCGSSMHTAFDYATQKKKTFGSVLIAYEHDHDDDGKKNDGKKNKSDSKKLKETLECRCEIQDDAGGAEEKDASLVLEEGAGGSAEKDDSAKEEEGDPGDSSEEEVAKEGEVASNIGDSLQEEVAKEGEGDSGDSLKEGEGDSGDPSEGKDSPLEDENDPGNRRLSEKNRTSRSPRDEKKMNKKGTSMMPMQNKRRRLSTKKAV